MGLRARRSKLSHRIIITTSSLSHESGTLGPETITTTTTSRRIGALDVIRGVALTGIIVVNVVDVTHFGYEVGRPSATLADPSGWLQLFVQQRFFPIFSMLFGMGFSLLYASADRRGVAPRALLFRRLLVLLPLGALHQWLYPGEALLPYAIVGLIVLLPSTWLPRQAVAGGGAVAIALSLLVAGGGISLIPGAFLLGSTLVRYGVASRLDHSTRVPLTLFAMFTVASMAAGYWQIQDLAGSGFSTSSSVAGAVMAGCYVTGLLVLLRTPLREALTATFSPLGRMALTNYVVATPILMLGGHLLDLPHDAAWSCPLALATGTIVAQQLFSMWWLSRYRQGPLEWLWRWATWGERPAFRRPTTA
jgi:uncharacterized protein